MSELFDYRFENTYDRDSDSWRVKVTATPKFKTTLELKPDPRTGGVRPVIVQYRSVPYTAPDN